MKPNKKNFDTENIINIYETSSGSFIMNYILGTFKILGTEYFKDLTDVESRLLKILSNPDIEKVSLKSKSDGIIGFKELSEKEIIDLKQKVSENNHYINIQ